MCIFDKLNTYISITIITNIFNQLKISFNEDICISNQLGHDGSTVAHLEDRTSEPMLPSAPRSLLFQIEIFVKRWSDCHVVKLCPYCFFFFFFFRFVFYRLILRKSFFSRSKIFLCNANISKLISFSSSGKQYLSGDIFTFSSITPVRKA